ncbi:hypothetical protein B4135_3185 [Caldibacillus debilis]|uniref:Uncharacterized protein n=1 Tax=Caldibacillus debilis TaxID=301148 RepID=A0A150LGW3_9BACI|nr:hypothetical protein B4135_3185 [Caldibacillus debilis]
MEAGIRGLPGLFGDICVEPVSQVRIKMRADPEYPVKMR